MSRKWCETHRATRPLDFKNKEEGHTALHANGTGPFMLASRQPGIKTVLKRNPTWWNKFQGNLQEVVYTPISTDATRLAALVSGARAGQRDPAAPPGCALRRARRCHGRAPARQLARTCLGADQPLISAV